MTQKNYQTTAARTAIHLNEYLLDATKSVRYFTCLLLLLFSSTGWGQSVANYSFTSSSAIDEYSDITGTTSTATGDNGTQTGINIGFTFNYGGTDYTTFGVSTNGIIRFGSGTFSSDEINSLSISNPNRPLIGVLWDDNNLGTGTIVYSTTGSAPNRVLTVNWQDSKTGGSGDSTGTEVSMLLRLYETSNVIEIVYGGPSVFVINNVMTASVGLLDNTTFLSVTPGSTSTVSSTTANDAIDGSVLANLTFKKLVFTPPIPCSGTPTAGTISTPNQYLSSGATPANLEITGLTSSVTGITFQWEQSSDDVTWTNAIDGSGATTATYTPPTFTGTTIYYRCKVTCTNGGASSETASVSINPPGIPVTQVTNAAASSIGYTGFTTTWVNGSGNRRVVYLSDTAIVDPTNATGAAALTATTAYAGSGQQIVYDGTGTSVLITGLALSTTYYVKVFEYTRFGTTTFDYYYNTTLGTNAISVTTISPTAVPWSEGFATTTLPSGWLNTSSLTIDANNSSLNPPLDTNYIYTNIYDNGFSSNHPTANFTTPIFMALPEKYRLVFDYKINHNYSWPSAPGDGSGNIVVAISTDNGSSFTTLKTINNNGITGWQNVVIDLSSYENQNIRLRFTSTIAGYQDYFVGYDNFKLDPIPWPIIYGATSSVDCGVTSTITVTGTGLANATAVIVAGFVVLPLINTDTQITVVISSPSTGNVEVITNGGAAITPGVVSVALPPSLFLNSANQTNCPGVENSTLTTIASTATDYDTYTWSPNTNVSGDFVNGWTFNPTVTTTYILTATNSSGCSNTATKKVTVSDAPSMVTVTPNTALIAPNSITRLDVMGGTVASNQNPSNYDFSASTGTYTSITGTTIAPPATDESGVSNLPIGFAFPYNGAMQTVFGMSTNGLILLGNSPAPFTALSTNNIATNTNIIAPLWDNNNIFGGTMSYSTTGTEPNRVLTVQWTNLHIAGNGSETTPTISMQAKLFENGNIQFVYGPRIAPLSSPSASIGISGDYGNFLSVSPAAIISHSTVSSVVENTNVTTSTLLTGTTLNFTRPIINQTSITWSPITDLYIDADATVAYTPGDWGFNVYAKPTATTVYTATSTSTFGCATSGSTTLKISKVWTGVTSNSWTTSSNWSENTVPTIADDILINSNSPFAPVMDVDVTVSSGKSLVITGLGSLTVAPGKVLTIAGTADFGGRSVTFKSDATGTAMFGQLTGTLTGASNVTVERFIPARRAYRFLSPSVTSSTSIRQNWQENGGTVAGLGTHITGTAGAAAGFDPTETNNPSLLRFTNGAWIFATNTDSSPLTAGNAYCLMVRGDRLTDLTTNSPTPTNTVLRARGTLFTGNFTPVLSQVASGYSFIGNPYQAPLNIKTALAGSTDINKNAVYYWDPKINARGGYITRNLQASQNIPTSSVNDYVQPGQAFFVVNEPILMSTPSLTLTENHKSVTNAASGAFRNANEYGTIRVNLKANINNQWSTIEGALAIFNDNFSWDVASEDATKFPNLDENVSFMLNNISLAIACQSNPSRTAELPIKIERMRHSNYQWQFELDNYEGESAYLFDAVNNSYTPITHSSVVPFTADANTTNRFKIVFQNNTLDTDDFVNNIKLYPNPAKAGASFYVDGITEATVSVYNVVGQNIPVTVMSRGNAVQVTPITTLSQGVYFVTVNTIGKTAQVKWIVE